MTQEQVDETTQNLGEALLNIEKRPVLQFKDPLARRLHFHVTEITEIVNFFEEIPRQQMSLFQCRTWVISCAVSLYPSPATTFQI